MHPISSNRKRNIFHIFIIIIFQMRNIFLTIVLFCFVVCCIILNSVVAIWTSIPIYIFPSHYWNYTRNLIINWNVVFVAQLAQPTASQRPGAQNKFHRKHRVMLLYSRVWNDGWLSKGYFHKEWAALRHFASVCQCPNFTSTYRV